MADTHPGINQEKFDMADSHHEEIRDTIWHIIALTVDIITAAGALAGTMDTDKHTITPYSLYQKSN